MVTYKRVSRRKMLMRQLKNKYRLVFFNDKTFEEVWHLRLSWLNVLSAVGTISLLLIAIVVTLIAFTPLRELIPGYPSEKMRKNILTNAILLDSLEQKLRIQDQYFENLRALMSGAQPILPDTSEASRKNYRNIKFNKSVTDSMFRQRIEEEEQFNVFGGSESTPGTDNRISEIHFFPPVKGIITSKFSVRESHFGIDIVCAPNEVVKATLDGTVIISTWTIETGNVIQIQHNNNTISVYKHNAKLFKKTGSQVRAGEAIAIVGNSGELTTGPHLHFEIWNNGKPVNPQDYIVFN